MSMSTVRVVGVVVMCAGLMSCVSLDEVDRGKQMGQLRIEPVAFKDAIPKEFGMVIGVTVRPEYPDTSQPWFERADGTIVLIDVESRRGRLAEKILVIPLRSGRVLPARAGGFGGRSGSAPPRFERMTGTEADRRFLKASA